jgi:hypothetical protein
MPTQSRRVIRYGNDICQEIALPTGDTFVVTYWSENALTMLGMLCTEQRMFDRFLDLARAMGTRAWQRITTMSEMAEKHKQYDLAVGVYETCLGPGMHQEFLRKKYAELQDRLQKENSKGSKA